MTALGLAKGCQLTHAPSRPILNACLLSSSSRKLPSAYCSQGGADEGIERIEKCIKGRHRHQTTASRCGNTSADCRLFATHSRAGCAHRVVVCGVLEAAKHGQADANLAGQTQGMMCECVWPWVSCA